MRVYHASSVSVRVSLAVVVSMSLALAAAADTKTSRFSTISIKNFGCVNETYYRGAQPQKQNYAELASLGIKTVIDLQRDGEADEQKMVEANGMKFFRLPMTTTDTPDSQTTSEFLRIVNDPANQPIYVHCRGGRHRTGVMTAIYRLTHDGWRPDQAYSEMQRHDFDWGFGHGALKRYVFDYFAGLEAQNSSGARESMKSTAAGARN